MPVYMVEFFLPRSRGDSVTDLNTRIGRVVDELLAEGMAVSLVQAMAIPGDELMQYLIQAPSPEVVGELQRRAGLQIVAPAELVDLLPRCDPRYEGET